MPVEIPQTTTRHGQLPGCAGCKNQESTLDYCPHIDRGPKTPSPVALYTSSQPIRKTVEEVLGQPAGWKYSKGKLKKITKLESFWLKAQKDVKSTAYTIIYLSSTNCRGK